MKPNIKTPIKQRAEQSVKTPGETVAPRCPTCGSTVFGVEATWTTQDGKIRRRRVCALCEGSVYISSEEPQTIISDNLLLPEADSH